MPRWALACIAAIVVAPVGFGDSARAQSQLERGGYLVNGILTCGNCHTPRGPGGVFDTARPLAGGPQTWDTPQYKVKGSNITPDKETGIGNWTSEQLKRAIQDGVRPNGTPLSPQMPFGFYKIFTPADIDAVVAYVKSVPATRNAVEPPVYKAPMHVEIPPGAEKPFTEADMADPVKRGFYLVTIGHCMECHTKTPAGTDFKNSLGRGGEEFKGPWGVSVARNITSHKEKGIGGWTDAEIKAAITQGKRRDGTPLKPPMGYPLYATMTDADLSAIVAYLRTVPPRE
jgi:mono/diheme cytochrome c family protein